MALKWWYDFQSSTKTRSFPVGPYDTQADADAAITAHTAVKDPGDTIGTSYEAEEDTYKNTPRPKMQYVTGTGEKRVWTDGFTEDV
jgi:hypothetical protein